MGVGVFYGQGSEQTQRDKEKETNEGTLMMLSFMTQEEIVEKLQSFVDDPTMLTNDTYSPTAVDFPDNRIPFVEYHLAYLKSHKNCNPEHYLSNLSLMIKKR